jgi:hypothetical protein
VFGLSLGVAVTCFVAVTLGATVQATFGFGVGMVAAPVLAWADPAFVPAAIVISVLPLSASVAWRGRRHVERRGVVFALVGRVPGVVAGALIVALLSNEARAVLVSTSVIIAVIASVTTRRFEPSDSALMVAGMASGFTGTSTGVGGPPMALTYQHLDPVVMRSSISAFFTLGTLLSIAALTLADEIGEREWQLAVFLLPAIGAGLVIARRIEDRIDTRRARPAVLALCTFAALALLVETFA